MEIIPKKGLQDLCERNVNVSGKFGEIRAKIIRNPKNLPALTPTIHHMHAPCTRF